MLKHLLFVLCFGAFSIGIGQTYFEGGIFTPTNWTLAESPYIITGNVTVFPGGSLNINPGVEVKVNDGFIIEIRDNKFTAIGTEGQPIIIKSNNPTPSQTSWEGILLTDSSSLEFEYVNISDAHKAIDYELPPTPISASDVITCKNCNFQNNYYGITGTTNFPKSYFFQCTFDNNQTGVSIDDQEGYPAVFEGCNFTNNAGGALTNYSTFINTDFCSNLYIALGDADSVINCSFANNTGYTSLGYSDYVVGNIYTENTRPFSISFNPTLVFENNYIYNNTVGLDIYAIDESFFNAAGNYICNNDTNIVFDLAQNKQLLNVCFCETDSATIAATIIDGYDDGTLGLLSFAPYTTCDSDIFDDLPEIECASPVIDGINTLTQLPILIYPNPADDFIYLPGLAANSLVYIIDISGKVMLSTQLDATPIIDVSHLARGMYTVITSSGNTIFVKL
ncbi:MAG TPA: T9SS type A sorting domain-containing protein [Chitinophagales bacterium]|nr:T9SS type A sorting domain-containing protein [Chitinophagales bacterium]HRH55207.1 T9SS type A sorting domain-containing protein [Chitinophagales bacterium]